MSTNNLPQRGRAHVLGEQAVNAVRNCFPSNWIVREQGSDYGIDMIVEIVKGTDVTAITFAVQIKGKDHPVVTKQETIKIKGIKASSINYWHRRVERVMIAAYNAEKNLVVWKWTEDIEVPETRETTIAIPIASNLMEVNWVEFTKDVEAYYSRTLQPKLQIISRSKKATNPSLGGYRKGEKQPLLDTECAITIFQEATILEYGGKVGIIDCGRNSQDEVTDWLKSNEVRELAFIAISHIHIDHYGGFARILEETARVGTIFLPPVINQYSLITKASQFKAPPAFALLLGKIQNLDDKETRFYFFSTRYWQLSMGKSKSGHPIQLEICFPYEGLKRFASRWKMYDHNSICPVFRISIGQSSFLLPGDATQSVWEELIAYNGEKIRSNGILLPHNGNFRSISKKILDKVLHKGAFPAVFQPAKKWNFPQPETFTLILKKGGILINVERRPAHIRLTAERLELG